MKIVPILFILGLLLTPVFVSAECSKSGTTVIFVNGILGTEAGAESDKKLLQQKFSDYTKRNDVDFINGFNESHVGGIDDLVASVIQAYTGGFVDYDLTNILRQAHTDLTTQKILLVGHSQGTFYTNAAYNYLISHGVDESAIAVYNVATPADRVAGDGKYLTSSTDKIIDEIVRELAEKGDANRPLPANITINIPDEIKADSQDGHSFSKVYLGLAPDRIISEIDSALNNLKANGDRTECFVPPEKGLVYRIFATGYAVLENADELAENSTTAPKPEQMAALANLLYNYLHNLGQNIALNFFEIFAQSNPWLASVSSTLPETPGENPPPAVQLSISSEDNSNPPPPPITLSPQDQLDDILEQMDILQHEMDALLADGNDNPIVIAFQPINTPPPTPPSPPTGGEPGGGDGGGGTSSGGSQYFPKILISEVQVGGVGDDKQEFVELYNPNDTDIDLTGWYLQRKTASGQTWSTYAPNNLFSKKISAKGYFLIARAGYYSWLADVFVDKPITNDNSFVLKNPNGEISDKLGFGNAQDPELLAAVSPEAGQSVGRKVLADGTEADTDINLYDFELQNLTPKAKNTAYTAPIINPPTDTTAPQVSFNLDAVQTSDSFPINFTITDSVGAVSSGVASYIFRWQEDGGVWHDDAVVNIIGSPSSVAETRLFLGQAGKIYNFQVRATDVAKNESDWQPETPSTTQVNIPKKILINEIQIDSVIGDGGTDDDWVELYNPNNVDVSLSGWSIQRASSTGKIYHVKNFAEDAVIKAHSYFLLVGTQANDTLKLLEDMEVGWTLSDNNTIYLANDTEEITASDDANISDKVGFGLAKDFETLPALNPGETKSIERKIIGGDMDNNLNDFRISDNPTPKASFMQANIQDATDYINNLVDYGNGGAPYYNLSIEWSSGAPDLAFFQVQYKLNDGEWKDWLSPTNDTQGNFKGYYSLMDDQKIYSFRVKAQDNNGNQSDWSQVDVDLSSPVVINEIALYGTNAMSGTSGDQWIELYNRTDKDIDLTGWSLISIFNSGSTVTLSGIIPKKGYFILEKEGALLDLPVLADQVQFFTNTLSTNSMVLYDSSQRFIDKLYIKGSNWSRGHFINGGRNYCSWERVSPYAFGDEERNWKRNEGVILNGNDRNGHPVYGTPGAQNNNYKMYTILPPAFGEDTTIKNNLNPYFPAYLTKISENTTLTIEPGVILKFLDNLCGLQIDGTLKAIGTDSPGGKIIFTSSFDAEWGGDTNPNGDGTPGFPGAWMGLYFTEKSKDSALENILLRFAGADHTNGRALLVEKSIISLKNSTLEKNDNVAMDLVNSNSVIDSVQFLQNNSWSGYGILVQGGSPEIKNSYFGENKYGIYKNKWNDIFPTPVLNNNTFGPFPDPLDPENKSYGPNTIADIFDASAPPAPPAPLQMISLEEITIDLEPVTPSNEPIISDELIILEETITEKETPADAIVF